MAKRYNLGNVAMFPIGGIIPFAGQNAPTGYLMCYGQEVSRTEYSDLFYIIGTTYGAGDGSTTFNVPDLRECIPVGVGTNSTKTITSHDVYALGQFKDDQFQGHIHTVSNSTGKLQISFHQANRTAGGNDEISNVNLSTSSPINNGNGTPRTGSTTHGKQIGTNYIIRAL